MELTTRCWLGYLAEVELMKDTHGNRLELWEELVLSIPTLDELKDANPETPVTRKLKHGWLITKWKISSLPSPQLSNVDIQLRTADPWFLYDTLTGTATIHIDNSIEVESDEEQPSVSEDGEVQPNEPEIAPEEGNSIAVERPGRPGYRIDDQRRPTPQTEMTVYPEEAVVVSGYALKDRHRPDHVLLVAMTLYPRYQYSFVTRVFDRHRHTILSEDRTRWSQHNAATVVKPKAAPGMYIQYSVDLKMIGSRRTITTYLFNS
jgi:hypothetical protein